jgi:hypothetical protein
MQDNALWRYFEEVTTAVQESNRRGQGHPYRRGTFLVMAIAGDVELTVSNVTEEDAILIVAELRQSDIKASYAATVICGQCQQRVAQQSYCSACRAKL